MSNEHDTDPTLPHDLFQAAMSYYPRTWMITEQLESTGFWVARIVSNIIEPAQLIMWEQRSDTGDMELITPADVDVVASDADKTAAVLKAIEKAKAAIAKLQK